MEVGDWESGVLGFELVAIHEQNQILEATQSRRYVDLMTCHALKNA